MKEEVKETKVTRVVYISDDGKEFPNEFECRSHEVRTAREKRIKERDRLPQFICTPPFQDPDEISTFYYVRNFNELELVMQTTYSDDDAPAWFFEVDNYPCWVCTTVNDDLGTGAMYTLEEVTEMAETWFATLLKQPKIELLKKLEVNE